MNFNLKIILIIPLFLSSVMFSQDKSKARKYLVEGNKNFLAGFYDVASANYLRALQEGEYSYKSNFNLGNALYRLKKYDNAIYQYEKSIKLAKNKTEESNAYFNIGDSYYKKKNYAKAATAFKNALKLNPKDEKARYNYALALEKLEDQREKEKQDQQNKDKNNPNSDSDNPQKEPQDNLKNQPQNDINKTDHGKSGGEGQGKEQSGSGEGKDKGDSSIKGDEKGDNEGKSGRLSSQDILNASQEQEKRAQQKIINKKMPSTPKTDSKDW